MKAIVYTTNTGSTESYARLLSQETGLPAYSMAEAKTQLDRNDEIIYLGWLMANSIKGYAAAARRYKPRAVCAVGMCRTGTQTDPVREKNGIPCETPLFTLQGNFDVTKLRGAYRLMMDIMVKGVGKGLGEKQNRTSEEDDLLDMVLNGTNRVSRDNLDAVLVWYNKQI